MLNTEAFGLLGKGEPLASAPSSSSLISASLFAIKPSISLPASPSSSLRAASREKATKFGRRPPLVKVRVTVTYPNPNPNPNPNANANPNPNPGPNPNLNPNTNPNLNPDTNPNPNLNPNPLTLTPA